jgi:hypothetical protein
MALVFVSYRRIDSAAIAGRIYDRLVNEFGRKRVFMDVEGSIAQGADFPTEIERALAAASALLVVIGRQWMTCTDGEGKPRISNEDDWVATEVAAALDRNILVLPVLVDGASMPPEKSLPKRISALCRKQACDIRASSWDYDLRRIIATLRPVIRSRGWGRRAAIALTGIGMIGVGALATRPYFARHENPYSMLAEPTLEAPSIQQPTSLVPPGSYNLDFTELKGADKTEFKGSETNGFHIKPLSRNWLVGKHYGHPPPYIYFVREASEKEPVSGSVSITASGQTFLFESVDIYSSVERTPYVITGFVGARKVFVSGGVVPNTFGNFARVDNDKKSTPVDKVSIAVETYTENPVSNPVGIDNITVRIQGNEVTSGADEAKTEVGSR